MRQRVAAEGGGFLDRGADLLQRELRAVERIVGQATPPETMILIWSAPWRICSRTAARTASAPSATSMQKVMALQQLQARL